MPFLIDGHNLIGRMPGISLDDPDDEARLVAQLRAFCAREFDQRHGLLRRRRHRWAEGPAERRRNGTLHGLSEYSRWGHPPAFGTPGSGDSELDRGHERCRCR